MCDFDPMEKAAGHSLKSAIVNFEFNGTHVHMIDTPGYPDFSGQTIEALAAVDTAVVVINAQTGIELTTERMMKWAANRKLCRMIVINKIDADNIDLPGLLGEIRQRFGNQCLVLDLPAHDRHDVVEVLEHDQGDADFDSVKTAHRALIDQIIEEDEALLARYLEDGKDPTAGALHAPLEKALREGHLVPVCFISAKTGAGVPEFLNILSKLAPSPAECNAPPFYKGMPGATDAAAFNAQPDPARHVLAHVFKVIIDPYMGKVGVFRVYQGAVHKDMQLFAGDSKRPFKVAHLYMLQGKDYVEVDELVPGDIGAVAKVDDIEFDCVLHDSHDEDHIHLKPLEFPKPMQGLAVETRRKGDEQRLFDILHKLEQEDPCFKVERHPTTNETVIRGLGEIHLKSKLEHMTSQYKLEVDTKPPQIAYCETITRPAEGHCRHKKQSGGAGQFGEVFLRVEPLDRGNGIEFVDVVKGGAIPGVFMTAVEKGVRQALADGVIAGFPVEDIRVTVHDGKTHPVDGKEVAFVSAGRKATIDAVLAAQPIVLEPIVNIDIVTDESTIGDLTGDLSSRRGQVTGTLVRGHGSASVTGQVAMAELTDYQSRLKSLTGGRGSYNIEFSHYAHVTPQIQHQLTEKFKPQDKEEQ
ncbi:MAG: elongation factor G [Sulfuricellaceae bacterium]|nr:elongation factor G [Sulfuricellaceae bacterium]